MNPRHLALATFLACAMPAAADCKWEWLCNGDGACKQMPVCGSVYDRPPPRPTESTPPATPPLAMRHNTFAGRGANPGTPLTCEHIMRKDHTGRWYWSEACFCTDAARAKDPTPPFANIVRCENGTK
jgi:hypothetical protein